MVAGTVLSDNRFSGSTILAAAPCDAPSLRPSAFPARRGERKDTMKQGWYNDDLRIYDLKTVNRIVQGNAVLRIGDVDPLSGKEITKEDVIAYCRIHNQQAERNKKNARREYTAAEKRARERDKEEIIADFCQKYGYNPCKETVRYLLEERWPDKYNVSISSYADDEENEEFGDRYLPLCSKSIEDELFDNIPDSVLTLREFAATLTGAHAEVYRLLLDQAGGNKVTQEQLAKRMGIPRRKFCIYVRELKDMYKEFVSLKNAGIV